MAAFITAEILRHIFPQTGIKRLTELAPLFNEICPRYGLNDPNVFHEFIATLGEESGGLTSRSENLNYSAAGLVNTFSKYFTPATSVAYSHHPEKIANRVYANRMGNGDESTGDGWKYRGAGFIQVTGKDMHAAYAKHIKTDLATAGNKMRTDNYFALDSACWIFSIVKGLNDEAAADKFQEITKRINGGLTNYQSRLAYLERAKKYLPKK